MIAWTRKSSHWIPRCQRMARVYALWSFNLKDINDLMPKIPWMKWGAVTNFKPTNASIRELNKLLPADKKWHTVIESPKAADVDGITIRRKTAESMT